MRCLGCLSFEELPARLLLDVCNSCDELTESVGERRGDERDGGESGGDVGVGVVSLDFGTSFDTGFRFLRDLGLSLFVVFGLSERNIVEISGYPELHHPI